MVKRLSIILAIAMLSAGSVVSFAQETKADSIAQQPPQSYTIKGLATDTAGKAAEYVTYVLRRDTMDFDGVKRGVTDTKGRFEFTYKSQPDTMILTVFKQGMTRQTYKSF